MSDWMPEGWGETTLDNIAEIRFSNVDKKSNHKNEIPVKLCNYMDVYSNRNIKNGMPFMQATANEREIERFTLYHGDVIITKDSETPDDIAVSAFVSENLNNVICGYHLALLRPESSSVTGEYLNQLFGLSSFQHYFYLLANGITRFGLTSDAIRKASVTLPPLPEQQKIAAILTSVDEVIEKTRAQIAKLKDLKAAMMQELFTRGIGHTEFKDSPVGRIPQDWEVVRMGSLTEVKGGKRLPKGHSFSDIKTAFPYIRVVDFIDGTIGMESIKYVHPEDREKIKRYTISSQDVYISIAGTIGLVGNVPKSLHNALLTENAAKIVIQDKRNLDRVFLKYLLNSTPVQNQFMQEKGTGGGVPKLALFRISETTLPLPSLHEQLKIASIISSVENRIHSINQKLCNQMQLKTALMQDLLTGKVRVNVA